MITVTVKFDNKNQDAESTTVAARFKDFENIHEWIDKIKPLHDEDNTKRVMGFLSTKKSKETSNGDSSS